MESKPLPVYRHILRGRTAQLVIQIRDVDTRELVYADDLIAYRSIKPLLGATGQIPCRSIMWLTEKTGSSMEEKGGLERLPEIPQDSEALKDFRKDRIKSRRKDRHG